MDAVFKPIAAAVGAVSMLLAMSQAGAVPPEHYVNPPEYFMGESFDMDCSVFGPDYQFEVLWDWTEIRYGRRHYDRDGNLVRINEFLVYPELRGYNSTDPAKDIVHGVDTAGTTEHIHVMVGFDEGNAVWYKESGLNWHANVPGWGRIVINAGTYFFTSPNGIDWYTQAVTPNWNDNLSEFFALCSYLQ